MNLNISCKYVHLWVVFLGLVSLSQVTSYSEIRIGDVIPEIHATSIEGARAVFRPAEGKIMLIQFWSPDDEKIDERVQETLVLFRRFHEKGLTVVSVIPTDMEDSAMTLTRSWVIPWLQVPDEYDEGQVITQQLNMETLLSNLLIDSHRKVLAVNLAGDTAHKTIASTLNVSPDNLPMPAPPVKHEIYESQHIDIYTSNVSTNGLLILKNPSGPEAVLSPQMKPTKSVYVLEGQEKRFLRAKRWPDDPLQDQIKIEYFEQMLPLRGLWEIQGNKLIQSKASETATSLIFSPVVKKGEIAFRVRVNEGEEAVRVIFGFTSTSSFSIFNMGSRENQFLEIEKWQDLDHAFIESGFMIPERKLFELKPGEWHDVRVAIDSEVKTVEGYVDGVSVIKRTCKDSIQGRFGLGTSMTDAEFENIIITGE